jgi:hypothetical protein
MQELRHGIKQIHARLQYYVVVTNTNQRQAICIQSVNSTLPILFYVAKELVKTEEFKFMFKTLHALLHCSFLTQNAWAII